VVRASLPIGCLVFAAVFGVVAYVLYGWYMPVLAAVSPDTVGFVADALDRAGRIETDGFSAWVLRPEQQAPAGLLAAVLALVDTVPAAAALVVAATAALVLAGGAALARSGDSSPPIVLVALVFVMPTSMLALTTVHKDGLYIAGCLFMFAALQASSTASVPGLPRTVAFASAGLLGLACIWVVRPYALHFAILSSAIYAVLLGVRGLRALRRGDRPYRRAYRALPIAVVACAAVFMLQVQDDPRTSGSVSGSGHAPAQASPCDPFTPALVRAQLDRLEALRQHAYRKYPDADLMVGSHLSGSTTCERLKVAAWSLKPALLLPYLPDIWSDSESGLGMRLASTGQILLHFGLIAALFVVPFARAEYRCLWPLGASLVSCMAVTAYAMPNIGTLMRFFAAYDAVAAVGLIALVSPWLDAAKFGPAALRRLASRTTPEASA
jgi:hypothetical protein